jgi:hypothetical protein
MFWLYHQRPRSLVVLLARLAARSSLLVDMQAGTRTGAHWQRRHDYPIYMNDVYEQATLVAGLLLSRER